MIKQRLEKLEQAAVARSELNAPDEDTPPSAIGKMRTQTIAEYILWFMTRFHHSPEQQRQHVEGCLNPTACCYAAMKASIEGRPHEADLPFVQDACRLFEDIDFQAEWLADFYEEWPVGEDIPFQISVVEAFWLFHFCGDAGRKHSRTPLHERYVAASKLHSDVESAEQQALLAEAGKWPLLWLVHVPEDSPLHFTKSRDIYTETVFGVGGSADSHTTTEQLV